MDGVQQRCDNATAGPWSLEIDRDYYCAIQAPDPDDPDDTIFITGGARNEGYIAPEDADTQFLLHSRQDVPTLLAALGIALEALDEYQQRDRDRRTGGSPEMGQPKSKATRAIERITATVAGKGREE